MQSRYGFAPSQHGPVMAGVTAVGALLVILAYIAVFVSGILIVVNAFRIENARKDGDDARLARTLDSNITFGYILMAALVMMFVFNLYAAATGRRGRFTYGPGFVE